MHVLLIYGTFMDDLSALAVDLQENAPAMLLFFYYGTLVVLLLGRNPLFVSTTGMEPWL